MNTSNRNKLQTVLYIGMAVALILCLFRMPYGYYQLIRFMAMAVFAYLAYCQYKDGVIDRMILFIILAILFQPFFKIAFGRVIWNIIDVIVAGYLVYLSIKGHSSDLK